MATNLDNLGENLKIILREYAKQQSKDPNLSPADAAQERINELLESVRNEINEHFKLDPDNTDRNEFVLFVKDKRTNPWRKQTEDIEPDVIEMKAVL